MQSNNHLSTIEPWQLTAYAFGELEPAERLQVESALESNPALREELQAIEQTIHAVRSVMGSPSEGLSLDPERTSALAQRFAMTEVNTPAISFDGAPMALASNPVELAKPPFYLRKRFAAILAAAAAIPIAAAWFPSLWQGPYPIATHFEKQGGPRAPAETLPPGSKAASKQAAEDEGLQLNENKMRTEPADPSPKFDASESSSKSSVEAPVVSSAQPASAGAEQFGIQETAGGMSGAPENRQPGGAPSPMLSRGANSRSQSLDASARGPGMAPPSPVPPGSLPPSPPPTNNPESSPLSAQPVAPMSVIPSPAEKPMSLEATPGDSLAKGVEAGRGFTNEAVTDLADAEGFSRNSEGKPYGSGGQPGDVNGHMALGTTPFFSSLDELSEYSRVHKEAELTPLPQELKQNVPHLFKQEAIRESGDRFETVNESPFVESAKMPLSTFSIDVDTASYSKIRQYLMENRTMPNPSMVRIEEMINYFEYEYAGPNDDRPFAAHMSLDQCPWNTEHQLVRIGLQARKLQAEQRSNSNLVFLVDVSGSMDQPNKLPLVKKTLSMLVSQLRENDRVAIVVYAGAAGCVLPSTSGVDKATILASLDHLNAGGSTNGGQGIQLAYSIAKQHFIPGGVNRVVLCTDGDFNVGVTGDSALVSLVQENAKSNIFLTCLGYGFGNYNDAMMEKITNQGNGIYGMVDNELEARRMMIEQLEGTLVTVAKDVKIQVDFNPARVAGYRLIGYDDRRLANRDFDNDQKDAGEIGAGHRVTALYEIVPAGKQIGILGGSPEASKYQIKPPVPATSDAPNEFASEILTLKVRYKEPEGSVSTKQEFVLNDAAIENRSPADQDMRWATAVAEFGLLLRRSQMAPNADWSHMLERASGSSGNDPYRIECLEMMRRAANLSGK